MHKELCQTLPTYVYSSLDTTSGMEIGAQAELHKSCRGTDHSAVIDYAHAAPFSHQFLLVYTENSHFDPAKRGVALAAAARTVNVSTCSISCFNDNIARDQYLCNMREQWNNVCKALSDTGEISSTMMPQSSISFGPLTRYT